MRTIETTGKTIEEAKELAAQELGVRIEEIEFEILDEGAKSFLGLGRSPARVRATTDAEATETIKEAPAEQEEREEAPAEEPEAGEEPRGEGLAGRSEAEWVLSLLEEIVEAARLEVKARIRSDTSDAIDIDIEGPDVAILIGKHGQTLDALQYLLSVALNRVSDGRARITLDAEGYRDRHAQMLTAKAMDYARRVKDSGQEAVLDPQPPRDRRIVHMALADDTEVYTYSEGEGDERHVVISPRK